jgi:hypothetical protein
MPRRWLRHCASVSVDRPVISARFSGVSKRPAVTGAGPRASACGLHIASLGAVAKLDQSRSFHVLMRVPQSHVFGTPITLAEHPAFSNSCSLRVFGVFGTLPHRAHIRATSLPYTSRPHSRQTMTAIRESSRVSGMCESSTCSKVVAVSCMAIAGSPLPSGAWWFFLEPSRRARFESHFQFPRCARCNR